MSIETYSDQNDTPVTPAQMTSEGSILQGGGTIQEEDISDTLNGSPLSKNPQRMTADSKYTIERNLVNSKDNMSANDGDTESNIDGTVTSTNVNPQRQLS